MKEFSCGDVIPGCTAQFREASDEEILARVAEHAALDHGITSVPGEVVDAVLAKIRVAA